MTQNLVDLALTDEQLAAAEAAITQLETLFAGFVSLTPQERRSLTRMGQQSKPFCDATLLAMEQNPELIPPILDLAEGKKDVLTFDQLTPLFRRMERLSERAWDTEAALGSDIMVLALGGYGALRAGGKAQGLDALCKQLSVRFARAPRKPKKAAGDNGGSNPPAT